MSGASYCVFRRRFCTILGKIAGPLPLIFCSISPSCGTWLPVCAAVNTCRTKEIGTGMDDTVEGSRYGLATIIHRSRPCESEGISRTTFQRNSISSEKRRSRLKTGYYCEVPTSEDQRAHPDVCSVSGEYESYNSNSLLAAYYSCCRTYSSHAAETVILCNVASWRSCMTRFCIAIVCEICDWIALAI